MLHIEILQRTVLVWQEDCKIILSFYVKKMKRLITLFIARWLGRASESLLFGGLYMYQIFFPVTRVHYYGLVVLLITIQDRSALVLPASLTLKMDYEVKMIRYAQTVRTWMNIVNVYYLYLCSIHSVKRLYMHVTGSTWKVK